MHVTVQTQLLAVSEATTLQLDGYDIALLLCSLSHWVVDQDLWEDLVLDLTTLRRLGVLL